jgi:hypothetical protein
MAFITSILHDIESNHREELKFKSIFLWCHGGGELQERAF